MSLAYFKSLISIKKLTIEICIDAMDCHSSKEYCDKCIKILDNLLLEHFTLDNEELVKKIESKKEDAVKFMFDWAKERNIEDRRKSNNYILNMDGEQLSRMSNEEFLTYFHSEVSIDSIIEYLKHILEEFERKEVKVDESIKEFTRNLITYLQ